MAKRVDYRGVPSQYLEDAANTNVQANMHDMQNQITERDAIVQAEIAEMRKKFAEDILNKQLFESLSKYKDK